MKTILNVFFAIVGLICALAAIYVLTTVPIYGVQIIGMLALAVFGVACTMIFGYSAYYEIKENIALDKAYKEQLERDWYYYEQQCAEEFFSISNREFQHKN